MHFRHISAKI